MKINNNTSFPYPVLGIRNDIIPGLPDDSITLEEVNPGGYDYSFIIKLRYDNSTIQNYVDCKRAVYCCIADCPNTHYNQCFESSDCEILLFIPRRSVNGRVTFHTFITAATEIKSYDNPNKHPDFTGFTFDIEPGEILAAFPTVWFDTDLRSDILHIAGTYMEIRKDDNASETTYRLDSQKIGIILPSNLYNIYQSKIGEQNVQIIHASLAFNALVCALYNLDDMRDKDLLWVRCLTARFCEEEKFCEYIHKIDKKDVPTLAQALLGNPYQRLFDFLETTNTENDN